MAQNPDETAGTHSAAAEMLKARVRRFAMLRSVQRTLSASAIALHEDDSDQAWQQLRTILAELKPLTAKAAEHGNEAFAALEEKLDAADTLLGDFSGYLYTVFDRSAVGQVRSTIPQMVEHHRNEVVSLLEFLLQDRPGLRARIGAVELIITVLCSDEVFDRRTVVRDPLQISPLLTSFSESLESEMTDQLQTLTMDLFQAAEGSLEGMSQVQTIKVVQQLKRDAGLKILAPDVLRAAVTYNARMYNSLNDELDASRQSDAEIGGLTDDELLEPISDELEAQAKSDEDPGEDLSRRPVAAGSVFEDEALSTIAASVGRRLSSVSLGESPQDRVAAALNLEGLEEADRNSLRSSFWESGQDVILSRSVLVGLLLKTLPGSEADLREAGVEPEALRTIWVRELDKALRVEISKRLSSDDYDGACALSDAKSSYIFEAVTKLNRADTDRIKTKSKPSGQQSAAMRSAMDGASRQVASGGSPSGRFTGGFQADGVVPWYRDPRRAIATGIFVVSVVFFGIANLMTGDSKEFQDLGSFELSEASRYLASAHRNHQGRGGTVVGRVDPDWLDLEIEDRMAEAKRLGERLAKEGVNEVMAYDDRLRLQIHYANGYLRVPRPKPVKKNRGF